VALLDLTLPPPSQTGCTNVKARQAPLAAYREMLFVE
jgi:hypothetical protein